MFKIICFALTLEFSLVVVNAQDIITGDATAHRTYEFEGDEVYSNTDVLNMVTMLGAGVVSKSLLKCKVKTSDTMLAAASGISYLGAEVYSFFAYEDLEKKLLEYSRDSDASLLDSDRKAFELMKKNYKDIRDVAETKKMLQLAAATGFTSSAMLAFWDAYNLRILRAKCKVALQSSIGSCTNEVAITNNPLDVACVSILPKVLVKEGILDSLLGSPNKKSSKDDSESIEKVANEAEFALKSTCSQSACAKQSLTICGKYKKELKRTLNKCNETDLKDPNFQKEVVKTPAFFFISPVYAEDQVISVLGMGALGYGVYKGMVDGQATYVDKMISRPFYRGVIFGAFAGLSYTAAKSSEKVLKAVNRNIRRLEKILDPMNRPSKAAILVPEEVPMYLPQQVVTYNIAKPVAPTIVSLSKNYEEAKKIDPKDLDLLTNLSGVNKTSGQLITEIADGIAGKNNLTGATLGSIASLGKNHKAVRNKLRKIKLQLGNKMGKGRLGEIDMLEKNAAASLGKSLKKSFHFLGSSPSKANKIFKGSSINEAIRPVGKKMLPPYTKIVEKNSEPNLDSLMAYTSVRNSNRGNAKYVQPLDAAIHLERFNISEEDINEKDKSIWKILSFRYFRTAYPVLADED